MKIDGAASTMLGFGLLAVGGWMTLGNQGFGNRAVPEADLASARGESDQNKMGAYFDCANVNCNQSNNLPWLDCPQWGGGAGTKYCIECDIAYPGYANIASRTEGGVSLVPQAGGTKCSPATGYRGPCTLVNGKYKCIMPTTSDYSCSGSIDTYNRQT